MASSAVSTALLDKALTNEIFSILENQFLFGYPANDSTSPNSEPSLINLHPASHSPGKVRILSIDAGGATNGVLAAKALLNLQTILRRKSGKPNAHIADFFDVVAGSGEGGILAALLFTPGEGGAPIFTAEESLKFLSDIVRGNSWRAFRPSTSKALKKVFGTSSLRDTLKALLIPCYDLNTGAPFLFSRADALELDGCDFKMAAVCKATTAAGRPVKLKSTDERTKIVAVGGTVSMSNPTAAAITHVLNNKQEFPLCKGLEDLLVVSLGNGESNCVSKPEASLVGIAGDGAADMVDQSVSMAFGKWRTSNYFRIQANGVLVGKRDEKKGKLVSNMADEMLGRKTVESVLFQGKKLGEKTNMEKLEILGGELIKEQERRDNSVVPTVVLKHGRYNNYNSPARSSSATTISSSTLSSY